MAETRYFLRMDASALPDLWDEMGRLRVEISGYRPYAIRKRLRSLSRLGGLLSIIPDQLPEACEILKSVGEEATRIGWHRLSVANGIRYATALQYLGQHQRSIAEFTKVLDTINVCKIKNYKHYLLQHMGKCFAEMGDFHSASRCFSEALRFRIRRNDAGLLNSTRHAISELQKLSHDEHR